MSQYFYPEVPSEIETELEFRQAPSIYLEILDSNITLVEYMAIVELLIEPDMSIVVPGKFFPKEDGEHIKIFATKYGGWYTRLYPCDVNIHKFQSPQAAWGKALRQAAMECGANLTFENLRHPEVIQFATKLILDKSFWTWDISEPESN